MRIYPGFETQGRHNQRYKTGVSVAPQKVLMSFNFFLKKVYVAFPNKCLMFSSGDALAQYYVEVFFPVGVTGNVLSFMVGISNYQRQRRHNL